jgi:hypothetical protein
MNEFLIAADHQIRRWSITAHPRQRTALNCPNLGSPIERRNDFGRNGRVVRELKGRRRH